MGNLYEPGVLSSRSPAVTFSDVRGNRYGGPVHLVGEDNCTGFLELVGQKDDRDYEVHRLLPHDEVSEGTDGVCHARSCIGLGGP